MSHRQRNLKESEMTHSQALRQEAQALRARAATLAEAARRAPLVAQAATKDAQAEDEDAQVWAVLDATIDPAMRGESLEWNVTGWAHRFPGRRYSMDEAQRVLRDLQQRRPHCRTMYVARKG